MFYFTGETRTTINRNIHSPKVGNTIEAYKDGKLVAKARWTQKDINAKREISVDYVNPDYTDNPGIIAHCDKIVEREKGRIVDNYATLKANLGNHGSGGGAGRPITSWRQAFGWLTHA